jgi:hypothetical protein
MSPQCSGTYQRPFSDDWTHGSCFGNLRLCKAEHLHVKQQKAILDSISAVVQCTACVTTSSRQVHGSWCFTFLRLGLPAPDEALALLLEAMEGDLAGDLYTTRFRFAGRSLILRTGVYLIGLFYSPDLTD